MNTLDTLGKMIATFVGLACLTVAAIATAALMRGGTPSGYEYLVEHNGEAAAAEYPSAISQTQETLETMTPCELGTAIGTTVDTYLLALTVTAAALDSGLPIEAAERAGESAYACAEVAYLD